MTLGFEEAARRLGHGIEVVLAVDNDKSATETFAANFPGAHVVNADVSELFPGEPGQPLTVEEENLSKEIKGTDVLLVGAPCQGHSDLNNHTRRRDPKNALYFKTARAAEVLKPRLVIVENVPAAQWDSENVVEATRRALEGLGYVVACGVIDVAGLGLPQRRRRFLMIASMLKKVDPLEVLEAMKNTRAIPRDVRWAIGDLVRVKSTSELDRPSEMSVENRRRVEILFARGLFDLPDSNRPPCHRDKQHSYRSVYGRLRWDKPAQTITTGFTSMGQGRYVHPSQRRTLTPHEAARLQTFPDWFEWKTNKRTTVAIMIGNAVPPLLMVRIGKRVVEAIAAVRVRDDKRPKTTAPVISPSKQSNGRGPSAPNQARGRTPARAAGSWPSVRHRHRPHQGVASPR
jgi:DNA (cytosine-5)-methyltransferase 1